MKFIHCSDLHLDSRMETHLSAEQARMRGREICDTFGRLMEYAKQNGVTAVIVAGDLFDTHRVTAKTAAFVLDAVAAAPDVDVLYLRGNHDESTLAFAGRTLPPNLKPFGTCWTRFDYGNVTITGIELTSDNCTRLYSELSLDAGRINIAVLHGQISSQPGPELVCLPLLREKNIRYLALGHLHSWQTGRLDASGEYAYCGCLEGRGFDECGEKGFVLLETGGAGLQTRFVPFARRTLHEVPVDITGLDTVPQIARAMQEASASLPADDLVRFVLQGSCAPDTQKDPAFLCQQLAGRFYFVQVKDKSRLYIDPESYRHDVSLKGEFIRLVMDSELDDEEKDRIIRCGLQALAGEEIELCD